MSPRRHRPSGETGLEVEAGVGRGLSLFLREKKQQFSMKYSQLADGRGRVVTSVESDLMLR